MIKSCLSIGLPLQKLEAMDLTFDLPPAQLIGKSGEGRHLVASDASHKTAQFYSATIRRYVKQRRETGRVAPKAIPGRPPKKLGPLQAELVAQLQAHDDWRLEDHCHRWEQSHGVRVSTATMSRAIKRVGWTRKKRRWQPASGVRTRESTGASR